jgi:hypothetical protein
MNGMNQLLRRLPGAIGGDEELKDFAAELTEQAKLTIDNPDRM